MSGSEDGLEDLKASLVSLLDKVEFSSHVALAAQSADGDAPPTALMFVRLLENVANVEALARFLWQKAPNYALSRKRRAEFHRQLREAAENADLSAAPDIVGVVRDAFLEFNAKYPHRSSEVGELVAYCIAIDQLKATQLAAKMALKTNNNMPVHGLDGIHAKVENGVLYIYFLESKLSSSANDGVKEFASSVSEFSSNKKQYRREYSIVKDLGNLDALTGAERDIALRYFDVMSSPDDVEKRERFVGVVLYSNPKVFDSLPAASDSHPKGFHEAALKDTVSGLLLHHHSAAVKHLTDYGADINKCRVYFVAVPDVDALRELFYAAMGYVPPQKDAA